MKRFDKFDKPFGWDLVGFKKKASSRPVSPPPGGPVSVLYYENLSKGLSPKDAAKQAQASTGISAVTGKPMKTRGYGRIY